MNKHSGAAFLKSRTTKLLVPSTIGLFVFFWIAGYYNMRIGGAFENMAAVPKPVLFVIMAFSGIGPLWYIQLLWVFSLLLLVIRKIEQDRLYGWCEKANLPVLLCLTPVIWGASQILNTPVIVVYRFGIYGAGFFLGYFVFSHDAVMDRLEKWWLPLSLAALGFGIGFVTVFWGEPYAEHQVLDTFLCNVYAWIATLAVLAVMKKWGNSQNAFSRLMSRKAWGLYLFHYPPLAASAWYLHPCTTLSPMAIYLLVGASAFAGALILYEIIRRIPVLRWCICGIGGGKSCLRRI
ncbi:MAG: acyltransferase family protein [Candidatus Ventricola sp.]